MNRLRYKNQHDGSLMSSPIQTGVGELFVKISLTNNIYNAKLVSTDGHERGTISRADLAKLKKEVKTFLIENGAIFSKEVRASKAKTMADALVNLDEAQ